MTMQQKPEIMAPAGSYESLAAAIEAGADSVYFGVTQLNMRAASAANFTLTDLTEIVRRCKEKNVLTYLAVNTLLFDHDITIMHTLVDAARREGVDAIIAFDFATIQYCNKIGMPVHMSVQFSISNYETVAFFAKMTNRVVLARELTLTQIKKIHERIVAEQLMGNEGRIMEIEAFVHGALCVAQSGRCGMSLYTHNASANRGACRQNCRKAYKVTDIETGKELVVDNHYVMSAADICTIDMVDRLMDAGICVFKIEGRGRAPEYVATVTRVYKDAVRAVVEGVYTPEKIAGYYTDLERVFHRGLSHGNYYLGEEQGAYAATPGSHATEEKTYIGDVVHYYPKATVAEIVLKAGAITCGAELYIIGGTTGVVRTKIVTMRCNDHECTSAQKGDVITVPLTDVVRAHDKVYCIVPRGTTPERHAIK